MPEVVLPGARGIAGETTERVGGSVMVGEANAQGFRSMIDPLGSPTVLLVEDDDAVRRSLQLLLRSRGYEVRAYPSAVGLAKEIEAQRCDCLVADLMMPQTDAMQLLAELRATGWAGKSVLISGFLDPVRESNARSAGYDAVLAKPISNSVLVRTVGELLASPAGDALLNDLSR